MKVNATSSDSYDFFLNGQPVEDVLTADDEGGEITFLSRHWSTGELVMDREGNPEVQTAKGKIEIRRKPVIYVTGYDPAPQSAHCIPKSNGMIFPLGLPARKSVRIRLPMGATIMGLLVGNKLQIDLPLPVPIEADQVLELEELLELGGVEMEEEPPRSMLQFARRLSKIWAQKREQMEHYVSDATEPRPEAEIRGSVTSLYMDDTLIGVDYTPQQYPSRRLEARLAEQLQAYAEARKKSWR